MRFFAPHIKQPQINIWESQVLNMIEKDPVCGRDVDTEKAIVVFKLGNRRRYFCSEKCARIFQKSHLGL